LSTQHSYEVSIRWTGNTGSGTSSYRGYERSHDVIATGKPTFRASADPAFLGDADRWSPEDLLVASLSQCHMLTYLALCARSAVVVTSYLDVAVGRMQEAAGHSGQFAEVVLNPIVCVSDPAMTRTASHLHEEAHRDCFIARSVNFPVLHNPTVEVAALPKTPQMGDPAV
jgi:organic hydroperoxide reductase OsmC/OhrA